MKVSKKETFNDIDIFFESDDNVLCITFGNNLDLYWTLRSKKQSELISQKDATSNCFVITKENYAVYNEFVKLFYRIANIDFFSDGDEIPDYLETGEDKKAWLQEQEEYRKYRREACRLRNASHYNDLFSPDGNKITWYSDETNSLVSNYLEIVREDNVFRLNFYTQPHIDGYDEDYHSPCSIPIRFRNSGSRYDPFNIVFMLMYNDLKEIDDIDDIGHQIYIEEYIFNERKKLVKR